MRTKAPTFIPAGEAFFAEFYNLTGTKHHLCCFKALWQLSDCNKLNNSLKLKSVEHHGMLSLAVLLLPLKVHQGCLRNKSSMY